MDNEVSIDAGLLITYLLNTSAAIAILNSAPRSPLSFAIQLCSEDYHWWRRSYLTSGSSALYLFLYAAFYFFTKLEITKVTSGILYFGYMIIASTCFFVLTGTIGFYAC